MTENAYESLKFFFRAIALYMLFADGVGTIFLGTMGEITTKITNRADLETNGGRPLRSENHSK
jgi:hypothetical protein